VPYLRKQIIHNDANEWNVLVQGSEISGIIDFGDLAHTYLINELAIAICYACYDKENPLQWATIIIKAYHKIVALEEKEIKVLYYLIAARLCTSVCNSAHARMVDPENSYSSVSEKPAWKMIYRWLAISPLKAEDEFRKAVNLAPLHKVPIDEALERRGKHISPILSVSYNNTNTRYIYEELSIYAEKLLSYFPDSLNRVFFVNSGSAASDLAIRMANNHTKSQHMMVMELGYHGNTQTSIEISDYKFNNPKGLGQQRHIIKTALPDTYKGKYRKEMPDAGTLYGLDAVAQIANSQDSISAFISEPVVGCAGQVPLPQGYLNEVYPAIRAQGGICISDEVQTGFGRLGEYFWGFEASDVVPDMVILGKPIANGHPMGAVVCTEEIASSFEKGVEFFSSFGGNPVSCAIATAVLDVIEEEGLQENARKVGIHYKMLLENLKVKYPCIGDVRGSGLFIGCEIVKDSSTDPDTALASHIKNELRDRHILVSTDGPFDNVIKTKPALCFSVENAETVVAAIDDILQVFYRGKQTKAQ